jgi:hypothetical protein
LRLGQQHLRDFKRDGFVVYDEFEYHVFNQKKYMALMP